MKIWALLIGFLLTLLVTSCASKPTLKDGPCHAVLNKEDEFVCADSQIVRECRAIESLPQMVCKPL